MRLRFASETKLKTGSFLANAMIVYPVLALLASKLPATNISLLVSDTGMPCVGMTYDP